MQRHDLLNLHKCTNQEYENSKLFIPLDANRSSSPIIYSNKSSSPILAHSSTNIQRQDELLSPLNARHINRPINSPNTYKTSIQRASIPIKDFSLLTQDQIFNSIGQASPSKPGYQSSTPFQPTQPFHIEQSSSPINAYTPSDSQQIYMHSYNSSASPVAHMNTRKKAQTSPMRSRESPISHFNYTEPRQALETLLVENSPTTSPLEYINTRKKAATSPTRVRDLPTSYLNHGGPEETLETLPVDDSPNSPNLSSKQNRCPSFGSPLKSLSPSRTRHSTATREMDSPANDINKMYLNVFGSSSPVSFPSKKHEDSFQQAVSRPSGPRMLLNTPATKVEKADDSPVDIEDSDDQPVLSRAHYLRKSGYIDNGNMNRRHKEDIPLRFSVIRSDFKNNPYYYGLDDVPAIKNDANKQIMRISMIRRDRVLPSSLSMFHHNIDFDNKLGAF